MAMTREEIRNTVIRIGKIANPASLADAINMDSNVACQIIASLRDWDELYTTGTVSLTAADGDITYALASDVDKIEQVRITSPSSYARVIDQVDKKLLRTYIPDKTIPGRATPSRWYYSEPTISSLNVESKQISFDYRPEQAYTITYSYKKNPPSMDTDGAYPFFDGNYHHIVTYYDLWKYSERNPDPTHNPIYWRGEWENGMQMLLAAYQAKSTQYLPIPGPDYAT